MCPMTALNLRKTRVGAIGVGLVCCDGVGHLLGIIETLLRVIKKLVLILPPRCLYPVVVDPPSTLLVSI